MIKTLRSMATKKRNVLRGNKNININGVEQYERGLSPPAVEADLRLFSPAAALLITSCFLFVSVGAQTAAAPPGTKSAERFISTRRLVSLLPDTLAPSLTPG